MVRTIGRSDDHGVGGDRRVGSDITPLTPDRRDPRPLHHQVRAALLDLIARNQLRPGDRLPTEVVLCEQFQVSRQTLRQAVDQLVSERVLYRQRPKGTYVGFGAIEGDLGVLRSVWEDLRRLGMEPTVEVLDVRVRPAGDEAPFLEVAEKDEILVLRRTFSAGTTPISVDTAHFRMPDFAWLADEDLTSSWYDLLAARGLPVDHARTVVEAVAAEDDVATQLNVPAGTPLLHLRRQNYLVSDEVISYSSALYRGDRYQFGVNLARRPHGSELPRR
jgi:GntR family transcriptional regulator